MEITYKLHDSQFQIFNDKARFVILAAGRRYGKTVLALVKIITKALATKQARVWYIAPTYRQAEMIAWKMLLKMLPEGVVKKKNLVKLEITLVNGAEIALKGADNEDSLRGVGLDFVVMDEYASMKANVWQEIVRPMLSDYQGEALFIGTPKGKNHFFEIFMFGQRKEAGYSSYQMKTEDNPYIPRSEIREAEAQLNERYYRQEYEASFEDFVGMIWPEFSEKLHVIEPLPLQLNWERINTLDPAVTGITAALYGAIDEDDMLYIVGEYYERDVRASEAAQEFKEQPGDWYADPAGKGKFIERNNRLFNLFDEYEDHGIDLEMAQNDVMGGINRVGERFKSDKVKIFNTCKNLIDEIKLYHWAEERVTVLGVADPHPYKSKDHACDCLRYMIASRFGVAEPVKRHGKGMTEAKYLHLAEQEERRMGLVESSDG